MAEIWSHTFDFTKSDSGFIAYANQWGVYGYWVSGYGWRAQYFGPPGFVPQIQIILDKVLPAITTIRYFTIETRFPTPANGNWGNQLIAGRNGYSGTEF